MRRFTAGHNIFSHPKHTCMMYDPFTAEVFVEIIQIAKRGDILGGAPQSPKLPPRIFVFAWEHTSQAGVVV
jgi:hypothetical protein